MSSRSKPDAPHIIAARRERGKMAQRAYRQRQVDAIRTLSDENNRLREAIENISKSAAEGGHHQDPVLLNAIQSACNVARGHKENRAAQENGQGDEISTYLPQTAGAATADVNFAAQDIIDFLGMSMSPGVYSNTYFENIPSQQPQLLPEPSWQCSPLNDPTTTTTTTTTTPATEAQINPKQQNLLFPFTTSTPATTNQFPSSFSPPPPCLPSPGPSLTTDLHLLSYNPPPADILPYLLPETYTALPGQIYWASMAYALQALRAVNEYRASLPGGSSFPPVPLPNLFPPSPSSSSSSTAAADQINPHTTTRPTTSNTTHRQALSIIASAFLRTMASERWGFVMDMIEVRLLFRRNCCAYSSPSSSSSSSSSSPRNEEDERHTSPGSSFSSRVRERRQRRNQHKIVSIPPDHPGKDEERRARYLLDSYRVHGGRQPGGYLDAFEVKGALETEIGVEQVGRLEKGLEFGNGHGVEEEEEDERTNQKEKEAGRWVMKALATGSVCFGEGPRWEVGFVRRIGREWARRAG